MAAIGEEADAAMPYLESLMEKIAENDDDEDDANNAKGTRGGEVDGKDAMPVVPTERGQQHGVHVRREPSLCVQQAPTEGRA